MNIMEPLSDYIELEYHDEVWPQPIEYENIPFYVTDAMNMTTCLEPAP